MEVPRYALPANKAEEHADKIDGFGGIAISESK